MRIGDGIGEEDLDGDFLVYFRALEAVHEAATRFKAACEGGGRGDAVRDVLEELAARTAVAGEAKERLDSTERVRACRHEWASMVNAVIQSGEWCPKCGALAP